VWTNSRQKASFASAAVIRQIKSRRMGLAGQVACMGEERNVNKVLMGKP
jgi:hypothetical protein